MSNSLTIVLSRQRTIGSKGQAMEEALLKGLAQWPEVPLLVIPHLYDLAHTGPSLQALRAITTDMVVLGWLYPRAAFWVLQANGVRGRMGLTALVPEEEIEPASLSGGPESSGSERTIWCLDLRTEERAEVYLAEIARLAQLPQPTPVPSVPSVSSEVSAASPRAASNTWNLQEIEELLSPRWYPVVDQSRCGNCLECLNFCLFGVFGLDGNGRLWVEMPDACRPGCPACARVCPSGAIMFPHYTDPAIAGGPGWPQPPKLYSVESNGAEPQQSEASDSKPSHSQQPSSETLDRLVDDLDQMDP